MATPTILWRRIDQPGFDSARLRERVDGATLEGTAVYAEGGQACRLDYAIDCDAAWRTVAVSVRGWLGATSVAIVVRADIDLAFTPATNLLPIRRLQLAVGASAEARAAWLNVEGPAVQFEPLAQTYTREAPQRYRYDSNRGLFVAHLETDAAGFVTRYPSRWEPGSPE